MALDGIFLSFVKTEIEQTAVGARVEKVYQPTREELVLALRGRNGAYKLLLSARANSARVNFTNDAPENPKNPPMFCMLLRKKLTGAMLKSLRQVALDRILFLDFDATNEIGDAVQISLCIEIMAQHSNIILLDGEGIIIDSIKRVDHTKSSVREILPGLKYELPPSQGKLNLQETDASTVLQAIKSRETSRISSAIISTVQGVSPIVCRELAFSSCGEDKEVCFTNDEEWLKLEYGISLVKSRVTEQKTTPVMVVDFTEKPIDFSFMPIHQYENSAKIMEYSSFSELLDSFYSERDRIERIRNRSQDLLKMLNTIIERTTRKLNLQRVELAECENKETLRIYAELINANQYRLEKGSFYYDLENFYENNKIVRITADPSLTPAKNAQKYYKEYRKANKAQQMLAVLIEQGEQELEYIHTVLDALNRADTERELNEIRKELADEGYLKNKTHAKKKTEKPLPPKEFVSDDGFKILVGRNNQQNDKLSLKQASNNDFWLHTKNIPGSHTIIVSNGMEIPVRTIEQAAMVAAYHSKAYESSQVPVDYTLVKNLKKPVGSKPGKVIYNTYQTIYVTPNKATVERLASKE